MLPSKKIFRGRLGQLEQRARAAERARRPGSAPGMRVSQTTSGTFLTPVRQTTPVRSTYEEGIVTGIYDDLLLVLGTVPRLVAKPRSLRSSPWKGPLSWTPGAPFRYQNMAIQPHINFTERYDFQYVTPEGAWARTKVYDRPQTIPALGSLDYTVEPQMIYPRYIEITPTAVVGQTLLIQRVKDLTDAAGSLWTLDAATAAQLTTDGFPAAAGDSVEWIDLNLDARAWRNIPAAFFLERVFAQTGPAGETGVVLGSSQDA